MSIELSDHEVAIVIAALACAAANSPRDLESNSSRFADNNRYTALRFGASKQEFQKKYEQWCRWFGTPVCKLRDISQLTLPDEITRGTSPT
jgi:hypothetical protein